MPTPVHLGPNTFPLGQKCREDLIELMVDADVAAAGRLVEVAQTVVVEILVDQVAIVWIAFVE